RCTWLLQLAEALDRLHRGGAMLEGLRPDLVLVTPTGQAVLAHLTDLLPLPLPSDVPVQGNLYAAPELCFGQDYVDSRADLYSFGAMLQALLLGRDLTDLDFEMDGVPKPYAE